MLILVLRNVIISCRNLLHSVSHLPSDPVLTVCSVQRYAVAELYEAGLCDREVAGSTPANGCCVPTPTQRAIPPGSANE